MAEEEHEIIRWYRDYQNGEPEETGVAASLREHGRSVTHERAAKFFQLAPRRQPPTG
jgi:hypothetical protein